MSTDRHIGHGPNRKTAYHIEWGFRREAFRYSGADPIGINFHPLATELRSWLKRQGQFSVFATEHRKEAALSANMRETHSTR